MRPSGGFHETKGLMWRENVAITYRLDVRVRAAAVGRADLYMAAAKLSAPPE